MISHRAELRLDEPIGEGGDGLWAFQGSSEPLYDLLKLLSLASK